MIQAKRFVIALSLALSLIFISINFHSVRGEPSFEYADSAIKAAEESINTAYLLILDTNRAGGDIKSLAMSLNEALIYLSAGKRALYEMDYEAAVGFARRAAEVANAVGDEAKFIPPLETYKSEIRTRNSLVLASEFTFFVVTFGFVFWSEFKRNYPSRIKGSKPEVASDEA